MTKSKSQSTAAATHLLQIKDAARKNRPEAAEIWVGNAQLTKERRERLWGGDLAWSWVYENSMLQLLMLWYVTWGFADELVRLWKLPGDKFQALMDYCNAFEVENSKVAEIFSKDADTERKALAMSLFFALMRQIECVEKKDLYLSDFVSMVREENDPDDAAFFSALQVDRTVISCPSFGERITRAELEKDMAFFERLARTIKKPWEKTSPQQSDTHKDLRLMLKATDEMGMLKSMTATQLDELFIQELEVYPNEGEDPARGLQRFVQRWRERWRHQTST